MSEMRELSIGLFDFLVVAAVVALIFAALAYADELLERVQERQRRRAIEELGRERLGMGRRH